MPTYQYINDVSSPITVLHGTSDEVVAYAHGQKLYNAITSTKKEFITIPDGGHNDLVNFKEYTEAIDRILKKE